MHPKPGESENEESKRQVSGMMSSRIQSKILTARREKSQEQ